MQIYFENNWRLCTYIDLLPGLIDTDSMLKIYSYIIFGVFYVSDSWNIQVEILKHM